jgi:hypothetical protein
VHQHSGEQQPEVDGEVFRDDGVGHEDRVEHGREGVCVEWRLPGDHRIHEDSQRSHVPRRRGRPILDDLGRNVCRGAAFCLQEGIALHEGVLEVNGTDVIVAVE